MSSLRRRYTDGPTESQKLYGSDLPPSLRWGAARKHAGSRGLPAVSRPEGYLDAAAEGFPQIPGYAERSRSGRYLGRFDRLEADLAEELAELRLERRIRARSHDRTDRLEPDLAEELAEIPVIVRMERRTRSRSRGHGSESSSEGRGRSSGRGGFDEHDRLERSVTDMYGIERKRRPYAVRSSTKDRARRLLLRDAPEETGPDEQIDPDENTSHTPGWLGKSETGSTNGREGAVAIINDPYSSEQHEPYASRRDTRSDARLPTQAGAERPDSSLSGDRIKFHDPRREALSSSPRPRLRRPAVNAPRHSEGERPRQSRRDRPRSTSSGESYSTWEPRVAKSWFSKSWSVRSQNRRDMQSIGTYQTSPLPTAIVSELADESQPKPEASSAVPSPFQRVRSWRYNQVLPTIETTLKRVVHATYGDLLQNEALKGPNPPGFIAVPQSCSSQGDTLYHILNLQQSQLDFEAFKNTVVNLPELRKVRESVNDHFDKAQRLYESRAHDRDAARSMNGFCHHTEANSGQARMTLIGLPFVQLKEHSHRTEAELNSFAIINRLLHHSRGSQVNKDQAITHPDTTHPTRTLFQYLNPRDNSRRDLKQVICHMLKPRDKRYLCVSQMWIFVANEELIITSSTLPEADLCGDLLLPLTAQTTPPKGILVNLHVVSEDGRQWLLRAADCLTYIDFAANFSDITHQFAEDFEVYHNDKEVKSSDWTQNLQQASTATMRLKLRRMRPSDFATRSQPVWSHRSRRFREKWIPESGALTTRMILMLRSSPVRILGFVGREERSELDRPFRKFFVKLRRYQDNKDRCHDDTANKSTDKARDDVEPTVNAPSNGRSSEASWAEEDKPSRHDFEHTEVGISSIDDQTEQDQRSDKIYVLPKAAIKAQVLSELGISFTERAHDFAVAEGLDESQLFDVMQMKHKLRYLKGLRKMTCECLLRTPIGDLDSPHSDSDAPSRTIAEGGGRTSSFTRRHAAANVFDERIMYKTCPRMSRAVFHGKLRTWMAAPLPDRSIHPDRVVGIPSPDSNPWGLRGLLGWSFPHHVDVATGENMRIAPTRFVLFQSFLDGLWLTLKTSDLMEHTPELPTAEEKLLGAVFALVTSIHESMERAEELPYHVFYYSVSQSFTRLFKVMNDLETHALTIETVYGVSGKSAACSQAEYIVTVKHVTIALLLAAAALLELENQTDVLEAEKLRRYEALAKISSNVDSSADYAHVEEFCSKIFRTRRESHRRKCFQRSVDHLESLGWNEDAARTILLNECRRRRIAHHADTATRMLEASFLKALTHDSSRNIRWKAAALPTDLVALLITQVLERPVMDGQDALNMYMRYITDLESNILTGEPSREPLDRIRYLRHELNAFSQLQQEQIDVLEKVTSALLSSDDIQDYYAQDHPHPRRTVFAALPKGIQIQKDIIQSLSDMLDDLQSEARAQILGVQDWRDNAAVVFTIITVIFLPLSFVASVFGMNTSDVRNMELTQWVFWTCAIVFTVIVVLITVYFVDVPPLWRWLERKGDGNSADKVSPQPTQRSRSHFFAGLARHSDGMAAAEDTAGLDAHQEETPKDEDLATSSEEESSSSWSDNEVRRRPIVRR